MLNLLLESNIFYIKIKNNRVTRFFNSVTEKMIAVRKALKKIKVTHRGEKGVTVVSSFYSFDFSTPIFEVNGNSAKRGKPSIILPDFEETDENIKNQDNAKAELLQLITL